MDELPLFDAEGPDIAARRDDNPLHQPELAVEGDAVRGRQRLAVPVEHNNRLAAISGEPSVSLALTAAPKVPPSIPPPVKPVMFGEIAAAVRCELGRVTLP